VVAYGRFVPILVKALQEQQIMIDDQSSRIKALEAENRAIKALAEKVFTRIRRNKYSPYP
jgi:hypothetical protein